MAGTLLGDQLFEERVTFFKEFLENDYGESEYRAVLRKLLTSGEQRLILNVDHLRDYNREKTDGLLESPGEYIPAFEKALHEVAVQMFDFTQHKINPTESTLYLGLRGSFGENHVNPRSLRASHIGRLVCVDGIITRCSLVRPKVARSVHYCPATKQFHAKEYHDATSTLDDSAPATSSTYPTENDSGDTLQTEFGLCTYRDHQTVAVQELPELAPPGQLPRNVDIVLDDDLADRVKPGDRVQICGVYRAVGAGAASSTFKTLIIANNISLINTGSSVAGSATLNLTASDVRNISKVAKKKNAVDLLAKSLAPSIYGNEHVKKAVLLMLLGGVERNLANGTHIRGDINMMMIGDPSTAKSQLLRFVLKLAPLAIATTGRGSSGVGLTAAVVSDKETGERRLEAGAMVLADRGVVCIDEFDKMSDVDRVAIHEVMEQQTVTIAKAGIHTTLNARCSVVAAANPVWGQYDETKRPHQNIALPDSLLSRFDLLFVMLDRVEESRDRDVSMHVLRMHRYVPPGLEEGHPVDEAFIKGQSLAFDVNNGAANGEEERETPVYEKARAHEHNGIATTPSRGTRSRQPQELLTVEFCKKYIHYAKTRIRPVLTPVASEYIVRAYGDLRNDELPEHRHKTLPVTARTLETLIRLATANAKARLSHQVEERDAHAAHDILSFAMFKETAEEVRRKRRRLDRDANGEAAQGSDSEGSNDEGGDRTAGGMRSRGTASVSGVTSRRGGRRASQAEAAAEAASLQDDVEMADISASVAETQSQGLGDSGSFQFESQSQETGSSGPGTIGSSSTAIMPSRFTLFRERLSHLRRLGDIEDVSVPFEALLPQINDLGLPSSAFTVAEAEAALKRMEEENMVMYRHGMVILI